MKILWVSLVKFPPLSEYLGENVPNYCGWMYSSAKALLKENVGIELGVIVPSNFNKLEVFNINGITYFLIPYNGHKGLAKYNMELIEYCKSTLKLFNPHIIHLHGTEFSLAMAILKCNFDGPIVASIQGLANSCVPYVNGGLSFLNRLLNISLRDILLFDTQFQIKKTFKARGRIENEILKNLSHVIGRTDWDKAHVKAINKNVKYHFCNETLRDSFYETKWCYNKCIPHTIFVSNGSIALKGVHQVFKALPLIIQKYPDAKVRIVGNDVLSSNWNKRIRFTGYQLYLRRLIKQLHLERYVEFLGALSEMEMRDAFLSANVYVLPSAIENSPNSLCEAQILGVPTIASYVGGIQSLIENGKTGYLYRFEEYEMLAQLIELLFNVKDYTNLSDQECSSAKVRHDKKINAHRLFEIYKTIL